MGDDVSIYKDGRVDGLNSTLDSVVVYSYEKEGEVEAYDKEDWENDIEEDGEKDYEEDFEENDKEQDVSKQAKAETEEAANLPIKYKAKNLRH